MIEKIHRGSVPSGLPLNDAIETIEKKLNEPALGMAGRAKTHGAERFSLKRRPMPCRLKNHGLNRDSGRLGSIFCTRIFLKLD